MANQTVTTDKTLEEVIAWGLNNGQNITINNGAIVTMTENNSVLIGRITINEWKLLIDWENISSGNSISLIWEWGNASVDETLTVAGQGTFEVKGDWFDIWTTDWTDNQVIDLSTATGSALWTSDNFISWLSMIQIETWRRINYTSWSWVAPKIWDWIRLSSDKLSSFWKIKEVWVGYVIVWAWFWNSITDTAELQIRSVVDNNWPDLQKSWTASANWVDIKEAGVYTEFWNSRSNNTSQIGSFHHWIWGMVFDHPMFATSLTLWTTAGSTGWFVPPTWCNIRVPNVMIGSAVSADFDLGNCTDVGTNIETDWYQLECSAGGTIDWSILNCGNFYTVDTQAGGYDCAYVGATLNLGSNICGAKSTFDHCVVVQDPQNLSIASLRNAFSVADNVLGASITNSMYVTAVDNRTPIWAETSLSIEVSDCIVTMTGQQASQTNAVYGYYFTKCDDITFSNNVFIGSDATQQDQGLVIITSTNFTGTDFMFSCTQNEIQQTIEKDLIYVSTFSNNFSLIGVEVIGAGMPWNYLIQMTDTWFAKIRCIGMVDDKMDFGSTDAETFINLTGLCNDIDIARCWKDASGTITEEFIVAPTTVKNISVQNCSWKYASEIQPSGWDWIRFKGLHWGSWTPWGATGWEDVYIWTYWNSFHDWFRSDTVWTIWLLMITPSVVNDETNITAWNPLFFKDWDLNMKNWDVIEFEMWYFVKWHTGFSGTYTATTQTSGWNANEWGNITLDFQYQFEGGSWNGSWLDVRTASNWTSISWAIEEWIKLKFRFTATGNQCYWLILQQL